MLKPRLNLGSWQCDQKWQFIAKLAILIPCWRQNFCLVTGGFLAIFKKFGSNFGDFELFMTFMQNLLHKLQFFILFEVILVCVLSFSAYFSLFQFFHFFCQTHASRVIKNPKSKLGVLLCQLLLKKVLYFFPKNIKLKHPNFFNKNAI